MSRTAVLLSLSALLSACGGVYDQRPYAADGLIAWSAVMPGSRNTALWLAYTVTGPASRETAEGAATASYELYGTLQVSGGGQRWYSGGVLLKPSGPALDRSSYEADRDDVVQVCGYSTCTESGRIKLLQLQDVPAGTLLDITGKLGPSYGRATLDQAALQLARN